jgi:iron complex transport system substrate-binding protein
MESNPSWNGIDAVINNKVEVLPSDLFGTNPGTRVTEAIDLMRSLIQNAEQ